MKTWEDCKTEAQKKAFVEKMEKNSYGVGTKSFDDYVFESLMKELKR